MIIIAQKKKVNSNYSKNNNTKISKRQHRRGLKVNNNEIMNDYRRRVTSN